MFDEVAYKKLFMDKVSPYKERYVVVRIEDKKLDKMNIFVSELIKKKKEEGHHQIDGSQEFKRFQTGLMGEAAIEQLFNVEIIDWTIGDSNIYHEPDLSI